MDKFNKPNSRRATQYIKYNEVLLLVMMKFFDLCYYDCPSKESYSDFLMPLV